MRKPGFDSKTRSAIYQLFKHGVTSRPELIPEWLNPLMKAEKWGCPPWEIWPDYAERWWWLRADNFITAEYNRAKNG